MKINEKFFRSLEVADCRNTIVATFLFAQDVTKELVSGKSKECYRYCNLGETVVRDVLSISDLLYPYNYRLAVLCLCTVHRICFIYSMKDTTEIDHLS